MMIGGVYVHLFFLYILIYQMLQKYHFRLFYLNQEYLYRYEVFGLRFPKKID